MCAKAEIGMVGEALVGEGLKKREVSSQESDRQVLHSVLASTLVSWGSEEKEEDAFPSDKAVDIDHV